MRSFFNKFVSVVVGIAASFGAVSAFAQTTSASVPTTATALAQAVNLSDAQSAGLVIVSLLIGVGVVLWGGRLVLSKFRPKI